MAINALTPPKVQFFDTATDFLDGGKIYTYEPGTSTPKASYSDSDGTIANTNPVILDSRGEASIYLDGAYKIVVKTSADVTVYTVDNFTGAAGFPVNDTISVVQDPSDNTKQVRIDAGSITTGTIRVLSMPDKNVTPADIDSANTWSGIQDFSSAGAYFGTAAAANLLDDYEEGTWTPVLFDSTLSASEGQGYGAETYGTYTKIGNKVFIEGRLAMSSLGTLTTSDNASIGGLPFANGAKRSAIAFGYGASLSLSAASTVSAHTLPSVSYMVLRAWDLTSGVSNLLVSEVTSSGDLIFHGQYEV